MARPHPWLHLSPAVLVPLAGSILGNVGLILRSIGSGRLSLSVFAPFTLALSPVAPDTPTLSYVISLPPIPAMCVRMRETMLKLSE
jgi:hypothetical protein